MAGTDDPIVPVVNGRILAKLIPDARFVAIDDGHLFLLTSAKTSADVIADFLNRAGVGQFRNRLIEGCHIAASPQH
jgi:pimeloyl-ACP methyl ester carboxylesterase